MPRPADNQSDHSGEPARETQFTQVLAGHQPEENYLPFINQLTLSFTNMSIRKNAPVLSGVYGLSCAREWIYVGHADNIQHALLQHLMEASPIGEGAHPTGFSFELCSLEGRTARQDRLVRELEPVRNRGLHSLFDAESGNHRGTQQKSFPSRRDPVAPLGAPRRRAI